MTIVGKEILRHSSLKNNPLRKWLAGWVVTVENEEWHSLAEIQKLYPKADGVKLSSKSVVTVFDVKGNNFRLLTSIDYDVGIVEVLDVLTHAEYDKELWKVKY